MLFGAGRPNVSVFRLSCLPSPAVPTPGAQAKALVELAPDDPTAPRLRELAEKLLLDATQDEREARELRADEAETPR